MKIVVHIDRLVLEGVEATAADGQRILEATQSELTRLLSTGALPAQLRQGAEIHKLSAPAPAQAYSGKPESMGTHVARAVHGRLGGDK